MAEYTKVFDNPYPNGWEDLPSENTPITASALQEHTDAIESIEDYLVDNPITSGTTDYSDLTNKPQINGHTLSGNLTTAQIGITVPTSLSDLTDDATHRVVTDTEKSTWNGKSTVSWNQIKTSGTKIAEVTIDGTKTDVYAEQGGSGGASSWNDLTNKPFSTIGNELNVVSDKLNFKANYGTTSEFNTFKQNTSIPDGATYHVTDDYVEGSGQEIYDGTERVIGTWFGKPLYRKVFNFISPSSNSGNVAISHNLSVENYITIKGFIRLSNGIHYPINCPRNEYTNYVIGNTNILRLYFQNCTDSNLYNCNSYVTIEYTKVGD